MNHICSGRAKLSTNLQIDYFYRKKHFDRAIEIDLMLHQVAESLINGQSEKVLPYELPAK